MSLKLYGSLFKTPLGFAALVFDERYRIERLILPSSRAYAVSQIKSLPKKEFKKLEKRVCAYFEGRRRVGFQDFSVNLDGTPPFHKKVFSMLRKVSRGKTVTYGELAGKVKNRHASRAVGQAMARNQVPLIIPCHRVIRSDGSLGNFSAEGGVKLKRKMLVLEGAWATSRKPG